MPYDFSQLHIQDGDKDYPAKHNAAADAFEALGNEVITAEASASASKNAAAASVAAVAASAASALASEQGAQKILVGDFTDAIRFGRLNDPLCSLFKKNQLVEKVAGTLSFARDSGATYVDPYGKVRYSPSNTSTNLLLHSEDFSNAYWTPGNSTITSNALVAPDGSLSADTLMSATAAQSGVEVISAISVTSGQYYVFSLFVKAGNTAEVKVVFKDFHTVGWMAGTLYLDGRIDTSIGSSFDILETTDAGDGWYRVSCGILADQTIATAGIDIRLSSNDADPFQGATLHIWGAQLEENVRVANHYTKTTTASLAGTGTRGITQARQEQKGWLMEGTSTNKLTIDSTLAGRIGNAQINATGIAGSASPDGLGTYLKLQRVSGTGEAMADLQVMSDAALANGAVYSFSVFAKKNTGRIELRFAYGSTIRTVFDTTAMTVANVNVGRMEDLGNNLLRLTLFGAYATHASGLLARLQMIAGAALDESAEVWGAQLEKLKFASSYIPTNGAAATRAVETASIPFAGNHPDLKNRMSELSVHVKASLQGDAPSNAAIWGIDANYNYHMLRHNEGTGQVLFYRTGGGNGAKLITYGVPFSHTVTISNDNTAIYANGIEHMAPTPLAPNSAANNPTQVTIGGSVAGAPWFGHIQSFKIFDFVLNPSEVSLLAGE